MACADRDRVVVEVAWGSKRAVVWAGSAAVIVYAVTAFTVTAGVLVGGTGGGFFARSHGSDDLLDRDGGRAVRLRGAR